MNTNYREGGIPSGKAREHLQFKLIFYFTVSFYSFFSPYEQNCETVTRDPFRIKLQLFNERNPVSLPSADSFTILDQTEDFYSEVNLTDYLL